MEISERFISRFAPNALIFDEDDTGRDMYIVISGRVEVYQRRPDGSETQLAVFAPGQIFGEMALVEAMPRSASARALEEGADLIAIDQPRFVYLLSHQPAFALNVMQAISQRLRVSNRGETAEWSALEDVVSETASEKKYTPKVFEIRPDIYQFMLPNRGSHVYLLRGRTKNVLIDAGLPQTTEHLEACLQTLGLSTKNIDLLILTHEHIDHAGGAPYFSGRTLLAAHRLVANKVIAQDEFVLMNKAFGVDLGDFCIDLQLEHGNIINLGNHELQVIHTPGHTSGGICLYEPTQRLLFSGDMVFAGGNMGGVFGSGNISDYIASLKVLRNLQIDEILPGHGKVSKAPHADLDQAIKLAGQLLTDSKAFLGALNMRNSFDQVLKAAFGLKG